MRNFRSQAQSSTEKSKSLENTAAAAIKEIESLVEKARESAREANDLVGNTADAYQAATTKGLGEAFQTRADRTANSMWVWVAGLIVALGMSAWLGADRVALVEKMIEHQAPQGLTRLHTALAFLAIAAPVWFAWVATKQIGQRFRLSEDYAYKASVAKAYEGIDEKLLDWMRRLQIDFSRQL